MLEILLAATLHWHAPATLGRACWDSGIPAHDYQRQTVLRLRGQYPAWYAGVERDPQAWTALVAWCRPDTDAVLWAIPGAACSLVVAPGQHVVIPGNGKGANECWGSVKVTQ